MKLLAGAKLLVNNGDYRVFSRPGGYAQARADFEALGLSNIKQTEVGFTHIVSIMIDENRYKQKISTDPYFGCYSYAVFTTKF